MVPNDKIGIRNSSQKFLFSGRISLAVTQLLQLYSDSTAQMKINLSCTLIRHSTTIRYFTLLQGLCERCNASIKTSPRNLYVHQADAKVSENATDNANKIARRMGRREVSLCEILNSLLPTLLCKNMAQLIFHVKRAFPLN